MLIRYLWWCGEYGPVEFAARGLPRSTTVSTSHPAQAEAVVVSVSGADYFSGLANLQPWLNGGLNGGSGVFFAVIGP